jgi:cardiolipin synthase C
MNSRRPAVSAARRFIAGVTCLILAAAAVVLQGCAVLPSQDNRTVSIAFRDTADTHLGRTVAPLTLTHPGKSGVIALPQGIDAFAARARLADVAERSLDVQYYIWHNDMAGNLLFDALRRAADRGVRVRLLLDDNNTEGMDDVLAELTSHRNIEVRLFNPFAARHLRALGYLTDFDRLDRRMHNKSFTADNQVTIIGGRNVGDEYFGAGQNLQFVDLDVMAIGDVVEDVSQDFDRYWASDSAYPAGRVLQPTGMTPQLTPAAGADRATMTALYLDALARQPFVREMLEHRLPFEWANVHMVSDDPSKGLGKARGDDFLWARLKRIVAMPTRELELVSPYFVPGADGVAHFADMARHGAKVTVLTNSLEATDVPAVHAGYAKRRKQLLEAGVELYEMKRTGGAGPRTFRAGGSSSASSLHAKTFSADRSVVFVGSFNFDPRSANLNTELGFVMECPVIASAMADAITAMMAERAYQVRIAPDGALQWVERISGNEVVHDREPGAGFWRQLEIAVLSLLPIEELF